MNLRLPMPTPCSPVQVPPTWAVTSSTTGEEVLGSRLSSIAVPPIVILGRSTVFDAPLTYDYLARPVKVIPNTAALPEVSADGLTWTIRIRPGIHFADDPAFKGRPRELTAEDYVYSLKRHYDPRWKSGNLYILENARILGLSELRKRLIEEKKPFDYDTPVEGLRTLDRYRFQIRLAEPSPRFLYNFTDGSFTGALAREVVEFYGDRVGEHPVGTGPFVLKDWKRSSRIVLAKNPGYREVPYDETAPAGEDSLFCGPRHTLRELFDLSGRKTGKRVPRWYLPRWFLRPQMALMEPLQRMAGLPAFMSRDAVDATRAHLDYSSAKAQRELGWKHPDADSMWDPIIRRERELMAARQGFLNKLRHQPLVDMPTVHS